MFRYKEIAPCKDCNDRSVGCHSSCERYKKWAQDYDEQKKEYMDKLKKERDFQNFKAEVIRKTKKQFRIKD